MEDYQFGRSYSAIYLRWCIGYLTPERQVAFLQRAQAALGNNPNRRPTCYIFLMDNVDNRGTGYTPREEEG